MYFGGIPNDSDFMWVPPVTIVIVVIVAPEMSIPEEKTFYIPILEQFLAPASNDCKMLFVDHFIGLEIEKPITRTCCFRHISLNSIDRPSFAVLLLPNCIDYPDLRISNGFNLFPRRILRISPANRNHKLIYNGKN